MADTVDTAVKAGSSNPLVAAVKAAGLVDTIKCAGPFTMFVPTDKAFAKLPTGTVNALLQDIPKLKKILTYHVISGKVIAADVANMNSAKTVEGSDVKIDASKGVKVNDSTVSTADDVVDNGVIYSVDACINTCISHGLQLHKGSTTLRSFTSTR